MREGYQEFNFSSNYTWSRGVMLSSSISDTWSLSGGLVSLLLERIATCSWVFGPGFMSGRLIRRLSVCGLGWIALSVTLC